MKTLHNFTGVGAVEPVNPRIEWAFIEVLKNQRSHARVLPWLGTGRHSVHLFGVPAEPDPCPNAWRQYQIELDASSYPTVGSVVVAIPDWCHEPSRRIGLPKFPPPYLVFRIVEIRRSGGITAERWHSPRILEDIHGGDDKLLCGGIYVQRWSRRDLDPMMPRDRRGNVGGVMIIEGVVRNAAELGFAASSNLLTDSEGDSEFLSGLGIAYAL